MKIRNVPSNTQAQARRHCGEGDVLKQTGHYIIGYTIMTNHVHVVIAFHNISKTINSIIGNGKRFIAYDIVKRLEKQQENTLLSKMQSMVNTTQKADNKLHEVFEPSFDWKPAWRQTGNAEHQHSYNRN